MLVPFLSTKRKLIPYLELAITNVLSAYVLPYWDFPLQSSPLSFQSLMLSHPHHPPSPARSQGKITKILLMI